MPLCTSGDKTGQTPNQFVTFTKTDLDHCGLHIQSPTVIHNLLPRKLLKIPSTTNFNSLLKTLLYDPARRIHELLRTYSLVATALMKDYYY